jgi:hypothetical protein
MRVELDWSDLADVQLALRIARETVEGYGLDLELVAAQLRDGESVPPFVDGEGGAIAAERLAASHFATGRRLLSIAESLEESELDELELEERRGVHS